MIHRNGAASSSLCDEDKHPHGEVDAVNEVQGLLVGLELLGELEGHEDDSGSLELDADQSIYTPSIPNSAVWNDLRDEYVNRYGCLPPEPPNFNVFLGRLHPSRCGWIECPPCRSHIQGEFEPAPWEIRDHFRFHHLGHIQHADRREFKPQIRDAIQNLMKDPEAEDIMSNLLDRCSEKKKQYDQEQIAKGNFTQSDAAYKAKLPSIDVFLFRLRVTCNGQLTCVHPRCADHEAFQASLDAMKWHFVEKHCRHLYEYNSSVKHHIIDDFTDCVNRSARTAEMVEQLIKRSAAQSRRWASMDDDCRRRTGNLDAQRRRRRAAVYRKVHGMRQWGVLRDLRDSFGSRLREFLQYAEGLEPIQSFAKRCKRPRVLLRLGVLTFRKIVDGNAPKTLLEVFAFISLSYAMAAVMHRRGVAVEFAPKVNDFYTWRWSIQNEDERRKFDSLVLWFSNGHAPQLDQATSQSALAGYSTTQILDMMAENPTGTSMSAQSSMKEIVMRLIEAKSANESFNFSAFLHLSGVKSTHQSDRESPSQQDRSDGTTPHQRDIPQSRNEAVLPKHSTAASLRGTVMFANSHLFMIFISKFGVILLYFGDEERRCQLSIEHGQSTTVRDIVEVSEEMRSTILNPLLCDARFSTVRHLFTAMDEVLQLGLVRDVLDLHYYMNRAVEHLAKDFQFIPLLRSEIGNHCSNALNSTSLTCEKGSAEELPERSTKRRRYIDEIEETEDSSSSNEPLSGQTESRAPGAERSPQAPYERAALRIDLGLSILQSSFQAAA
ncbi:hypothetical protein MMC30_005000 [Trapelia coarctata]|nr:hypothetical protein [Trapelia coarctata]